MGRMSEKGRGLMVFRAMRRATDPQRAQRLIADALPSVVASTLDALAVGVTRTKVNWIVDADIAGFFDAVSHEWLMRFVEHRIGDRRINRLIRKWLKAGVMEDGELVTTETGIRTLSRTF